MKLVISSWVGRLGNNVLQIVRACHYARFIGAQTIELPVHFIFNSREILLSTSKQKTSDDQKSISTFFSLKEFSLEDPNIEQMRVYAQKYISPILPQELYSQSNEIFCDSDLLIHLRGGDVFSFWPHAAYYQPPLYFYKQLMQKHNRCFFLAEDDRNPCVKSLREIGVKELSKNELLYDLKILFNGRNLAFGAGTFGILIYLLSKKVNKIFLPDYVLSQYPEIPESIKNRFVEIALPDYCKPNSWRNTWLQRYRMIHYAPTNLRNTFYD